MKPEAPRRIAPITAIVLLAGLLFLAGCGENIANLQPLSCGGKGPQTAEIIQANFQDGATTKIDGVRITRSGGSLSILDPSTSAPNLKIVTATSDGELVFEVPNHGRTAVYTTTLQTSLRENDSTDLNIQCGCK